MIKHMEVSRMFYRDEWIAFLVMEHGPRVQLDGKASNPDTWRDMADWLRVPFVEMHHE